MSDEELRAIYMSPQGSADDVITLKQMRERAYSGMRALFNAGRASAPTTPDRDELISKVRGLQSHESFGPLGTLVSLDAVITALSAPENGARGD